MTANIETMGFARRYSFAPLVTLLVLAGAIGATYAVARSEPAPSQRFESLTSYGLGRDALVGSGYTGRLGGVAFVEWRPAAQVAGFTGRLGAATRGSADWTEQARKAGFTGRLGG